MPLLSRLKKGSCSVLSLPGRMTTVFIQRTAVVLLLIITQISAFLLSSGFCFAQEELWVEETVENERALFLKGQEFIDIGDYDRAIEVYRKIISTFPASPVLDSAFFKTSEVYLLQKNEEEAIRYLEKLLDLFPASMLVQDARLKLANAYHEVGRFDDALPLFEGMEKDASSLESKWEILGKLVEIYTSKKDMLAKGIATLLKKKQYTEDAALLHEIDTQIKSYIDKASDEDLYRVSDEYRDFFPGDYALIRLIKRYEQSENLFLQERAIKRFLYNFRHHSFRPEAFLMLGQIESQLKAKRFLVGVATHTTGAFSQYGNSMLNGVQLALEEASEYKDELGLIIKDFNEEGVFASINEFTKKYKPQAIIGPLLSPEVTKMGFVITRYGIPVVSPTATRYDAGAGNNYIFKVSMTDKAMVSRLVDYAMGVLSLKRFVILRPGTHYYNHLAHIFKNEVEAREGVIVVDEIYPSNVNDYSLPIKAIIKKDLSGEGEMVLPEIEEIAEAAIPQKKVYKPGYDAIFLPGDAATVGQVIPQLAFFDIENVQLLGDNGWNSADLLKYARRYAEGAVFVDGFFKNSNNPVVGQFVNQYVKRYGKKPDVFAAQGYDAMKLVTDAIKNGAATKEDISLYLRNIETVDGVTGKMNFSSDGNAVKDLFLLKVQGRRFVTVNLEPVNN